MEGQTIQWTPKRTNNDIQNIAQKTKDRDTLTQLKSGMDSGTTE